MRSASLPISTGVYQGTALGPVLFSIFCNDLALHIPEATVVQYADDVQILVKGRKQQITELISSGGGGARTPPSWHQLGEKRKCFHFGGIKVNDPTKNRLSGSIFAPKALRRLFLGIGTEKITATRINTSEEYYSQKT